MDNEILLNTLVCLVVVLSILVVTLYLGVKNFTTRDALQQRAISAVSVAIGNQHLATLPASDEVIALMDSVLTGPTRKWKDVRVENLCRVYFTRVMELPSIACLIDAGSPPPKDNQTVLALMLKKGLGIVVMSVNVAHESLVVIGSVAPTYSGFEELSKLITQDPFAE